ncbi:MAG: BspA family leucine-rich repeat surface protein [Eubacterium sp.]
MKKLLKKLLTAALCISLVLATSMLSSNTKVDASAKKVKLSKKTVTINGGKSKSVKLKNVNKKVTWKVTKGKKNVTIKKSGKYKNKIKITGKKKGTATIKATYKKKTYKIKVTVKSNAATNNKQNNQSAKGEDIYAGYYVNEHKLAFSNNAFQISNADISFGAVNNNDFAYTVTEDGTTIVSGASWRYYSEEINCVEILNTIKPKNMSGWFADLWNLTQIKGLEKVDTSNVTKMDGTFARCGSLTNIDISKFNTSKVQSMNYMFFNCGSLTKLDVSKFNTSKVQSMKSMFSFCRALTNIDLSGFDTSKVQSMEDMFNCCFLLEKIDVSKFNTSKVQNMNYMFSNCSNLKELNLSSFDTISTRYMNSMFESCSELKTITYGNKFTNYNLVSNNNMFENCPANRPVWYTE